MASLAQQEIGVTRQAQADAHTAWRWSQRWRDVLFLHWPVTVDSLRSHLPPELDVDTRDGQAWVSIVGFRLQAVRLCGLPAVPFFSQMLEVNFRTYVRYRDEPAIYFLSMHADHPAMIAAARLLTPLPYTLARLSYAVTPVSGMLTCHPCSSDRPLLTARFQLGSACSLAEPGSLDAWLIERYVAYVANSRGELLRMSVSHEPWPVQRIALQHCEHRVSAVDDVNPECHFSDGVEALLGRFTRV